MAVQQFPEPTVGVFIFNQQGEVLLLQSHKWPGAYVVPGGHVELGERIPQAAIREAKEETGLDIYDRYSLPSRNLSTIPPSGSSVTLSSSTTLQERTARKWC